MKFYKVPETIRDDILALKKEVEKFKNGETPANKFMGFRVPLGIYEQRQQNIYMMRVRIPGGGISATQLKSLGEICNRYNLAPHITTRQDIQLQNTKLEYLPIIYQELFKIGLTCKGGGGNTVRNITACAFAGICSKETFNVLPYSIALTEYLIKFQSSYNLPRKFKIAFSGCSFDCAFATVNDLGFIAKIKDSKKGFSVWAGGGMGAYSRVAEKLSDFVEDNEIGLIAEAVKRLFDKYGNRQNKHKARLRFVLDKFGVNEFRRLFEEELKSVKEEGPIELEIREIKNGDSPLFSSKKDGQSLDKEFEEWKKINVKKQNKNEYHYIRIIVPLGDSNGDNLIKLSEIVSGFGEEKLRTTQNQDFILRNIREEEIPLVYNKLKNNGLLNNFKENINYIVSCKGALTCKLGICFSTEIAKAISDELDKTGFFLPDFPEINMKISGCPNACGQHPLGTIGFSGTSRRTNGRLVPYYNVLLDGKVQEGETRLSKSFALIPAKNIPGLINDLLKEFIKNKGTYKDFYEFIEKDAKEVFVTLIEKYSKVPSYEENKKYYMDFGSNEDFSLAGRGVGECGAGVFDMIESDIESAKKSYETGDFYNSILYLAKSLLVIRGVDPKDDISAFNAFEENFINTGWVSKKYLSLIDGVKKETVPKSGDGPIFNELTDRITQLYKSMDSNLQFQIEKEEQTEKEEQSHSLPWHKLDLRGTPCPINYVKTKLFMEGIKINEVLEVLLDEGEPIQNVPVSIKNDGQEIMKIEKKENYYSIVIRRLQ